MSDMTEQLVTRLAVAEKDLADLRGRVVGMVPASIAPTSGGLEAQVAAIQSSVASLFVSMPQVAAGASREGEDELLVIDPVVFLTLAVTSGTSTLTGNATTKCAYTYDVEDALTGYKYFGTGTSPAVAAADPIAGVHKWVRPEFGYMIAATFGYAHRNATGVLVIGWINELAEQEACDGDETTIDQGVWT
jgi:hypothetical protein